MAKRWYVVHAYSGFENRVKQSLLERIERSGMQDKFGEIMVPTEEVVEMREGQKRRSERKFFPGYVLVQMEMDDETWHLVKEVPKVLGFIGGSSDRPAPITEKEANTILQRVQEGVDKPRPKVLFEPGPVDVGEPVRCAVGASLHLLTDGKSIYLENDESQIIDLLKNARQPMFLVCVTDQARRLDLDRKKPGRSMKAKHTSSPLSRRTGL